MQGQFCSGQIQSKCVVIGIEFSAAPRGDLQPRAIGGGDAQSLPAARIDDGSRQVQQIGIEVIEIEVIEHLCGKTAAHLGEGAIAAFAGAHRAARSLCKQIVERGLHRGAHAGHHHGQCARQGECAVSGKSAGAKPKRINQGGIVEA